jgi:hypothetical protein
MEIQMDTEKNITQYSHDGKYFWLCVFAFKGDKLEIHLAWRNNCETLKQLRRAWRVEKPNLKLLRAVRKE